MIKTLTEEELVMHRLVGKHDFVKKGLVTICDVCGLNEGDDDVPFLFKPGDKINSDEVNANFRALVVAIRDTLKTNEDLAYRIERLEDLLFNKQNA